MIGKLTPFALVPGRRAEAELLSLVADAALESRSSLRVNGKGTAMDQSRASSLTTYRLARRIEGTASRLEARTQPEVDNARHGKTAGSAFSRRVGLHCLPTGMSIFAGQLVGLSSEHGAESPVSFRACNTGCFGFPANVHWLSFFMLLPCFREE